MIKNQQYEKIMNDPFKRDDFMKVLKFIQDNPMLNNYFLKAIAENQDIYRQKCETQNNNQLREALGDACIILAMKKKPSLKDMANHYCIRIKKAIFQNGITEYHHQGEKNFYEKMGWDNKNNKGDSNGGI